MSVGVLSKNYREIVSYVNGHSYFLAYEVIGKVLQSYKILTSRCWLISTFWTTLKIQFLKLCLCVCVCEHNNSNKLKIGISTLQRNYSFLATFALFPIPDAAVYQLLPISTGRLLHVTIQLKSYSNYVCASVISWTWLKLLDTERCQKRGNDLRKPIWPFTFQNSNWLKLC